jgi:uncharacterized membrane protein
MNTIICVIILMIVCIIWLFYIRNRCVIDFYIHEHMAKRCRLCGCSKWYLLYKCSCICHKNFGEN